MSIQKTLLVIILFYFQQNFTYCKSKEESIFLMSYKDSIKTELVTYNENFEDGHVNGWESYPPFQDTGFDPNFYCKKIDGPNNSKYSLMIEYHPTFKTEGYLGFIKRLFFITAKNSKISFYYKACGYGNLTKLQIILYGAEGKRYIFTTSVGENDKWNFIEVSTLNFKSFGINLQPGTVINGFSIVANIPRTNPDVTYRLYLDELNIIALKPVRFHIVEPSSEYLENLNMIVPLHHYKLGDKFTLIAKLPKEIKLKSVKMRLSNPFGKIILTNISLAHNSSENSWYGDNLYYFTKDDVKGQWQVELMGIDSNNRRIETKFNIWLVNKKHTHPRMYFSNSDDYLIGKIGELKHKIEEEPWKSWWDSLVIANEQTRKTSNLGSIIFGSETSSITKIPPSVLSLKSLYNVDLSIYDTVYLLPTLGHYFNIMVPAMKLLQENALIYALSGDTAAGNYAKESLLIIANWKTWTHPWFRARHRETYYPVGELGVRAAFCYDIVYSIMTEEERNKVSEDLLRNCIIPAYQEYVLEDRVPSATSNWVGNTVSGAISSALAIYGDNPVLGDLEPYVSGLIKKLEDHLNNTLDTAGAWGEGISYQAFSLSNVLPTLSVIKNVLGLDLTSKGLFNCYKYFLYNYSTPEILDVGDSHPVLSTLSNFAWLSSHTNDPIFKWFYRQSPRNNIFDFLFGNDKGDFSPPTQLPKSKIFPELGAAVFRSGWSPDDIVLNFRSGPFYNHQHFDQGSIQLNAYGEALITEAGFANYYNDPWYSRYYTQSVGHSTVLLNKDPGSQRSGDYLHFINAANNYASIKNFVSTDFYSAVSGEISKVYRENLSLFERTIIFVNRKYFVIYDKIESSKTPHEYDLLFHFKDIRNVNVKGNNIFTYIGDKASLYGQVLFPSYIASDIAEGPVYLGTPIRKPGYIQFSNVKKSTEANFLTILYPLKKDNFVNNIPENITKIQGNGYIGISVKTDRHADKLLFNVSKLDLNSGDTFTNSEFVSLTLENNKLLNFAAHNATFFTYDGIELFKTDVPIVTAVKLSQNSDEWLINSNKEGVIHIRLSSYPRKIIINNNELLNGEYKINQGRLVINFSEGNNLIEIKYK